MAGKALGLGEHGEIEAIPQKRDEAGKWKRAAHHRSAERWRARVYFCGFDGVTREISRFGKSKRAAVENVEGALKEQPSLGANAKGVTLSTPIITAGEYWIEQIKRPESKLSAETVDDYERAFNNHVKGESSAIRGLSLKQANDPQRLRLFLQDVADRRGTGAAKMTRQVLSGILWMAVDDGVITIHALKMVKPIQAKMLKQTKRQAEHDHRRAYSEDEAEAVLACADKLAADETANPRTTRKWQTTADLMAFMKGTGARIGEARRVQWEHMDLLTGWVLILGTKTPKSNRAVKMPSWLLERMRVRGGRIGVEGMAFAAPHQLDDPWKEWNQSNCNAAVRRVLDLAEMFWAIPHTWRRYVATRLEKAGWAPSDIADQLGHVDASMTQQKYLDRDLMARGDSRAADVL